MLQCSAIPAVLQGHGVTATSTNSAVFQGQVVGGTSANPAVIQGQGVAATSTNPAVLQGQIVGATSVNSAVHQDHVHAAKPANTAVHLAHLQCSFCHEEIYYNHIFEMSDHIARCQAKLSVCPLCKNDYSRCSTASKKLHLATCVGENDSRQSSDSVCLVCCADFKDMQTLEKHIQHYHNFNELVEKTELREANEAKNIPANVGEEQLHLDCPHCELSMYFDEELAMKMHLATCLDPIAKNSWQYSKRPDENRNKTIYHHICEYCNMNLETKEKLENHVSNHSLKTLMMVFKCEDCDQRFRFEKGFISHKRVHAKDKKMPESAERDKAAGTVIPQISAVNVRVTQAQPQLKESSEEISSHNLDALMMLCPHCDTSIYYTNEDNLKVHLGTCIAMNEERRKKQGNLLTHYAGACELCDAYFVSQEYLIKHIVCHSMQELLACKICISCNQRFRKEEDLLAHRSAAHGFQVVEESIAENILDVGGLAQRSSPPKGAHHVACSHCDMEIYYNRENELRIHLATCVSKNAEYLKKKGDKKAENRGRYTCQVCLARNEDAEFSYRELCHHVLANHSMSHLLLVKPCKVCGCRFRSKEQLSEHAKRWEGKCEAPMKKIMSAISEEMLQQDGVIPGTPLAKAKMQANSMKCPHCSYDITYRLIEDLQYHLATCMRGQYLGKPNEVCQVCGDHHSVRLDMWNHARTHLLKHLMSERVWTLTLQNRHMFTSTERLSQPAEIISQNKDGNVQDDEPISSTKRSRSEEEILTSPNPKKKRSSEIDMPDPSSCKHCNDALMSMGRNIQNPHQCRFCNVAMGSSIQLRKHERDHTTVHICLECAICHSRHANQERLISHMLLHIKSYIYSKEEEELICTVCDHREHINNGDRFVHHVISHQAEGQIPQSAMVLNSQSEITGTSPMVETPGSTVLSRGDESVDLSIVKVEKVDPDDEAYVEERMESGNTNRSHASRASLLVSQSLFRNEVARGRDRERSAELESEDYSTDSSAKGDKDSRIPSERLETTQFEDQSQSNQDQANRNSSQIVPAGKVGDEKSERFMEGGEKVESPSSKSPSSSVIAMEIEPCDTNLVDNRMISKQEAEKSLTNECGVTEKKSADIEGNVKNDISKTNSTTEDGKTSRGDKEELESQGSTEVDGRSKEEKKGASFSHSSSLSSSKVAADCEVDDTDGKKKDTPPSSHKSTAKDSKTHKAVDGKKGYLHVDETTNEAAGDEVHADGSRISSTDTEQKDTSPLSLKSTAEAKDNKISERVADKMNLDGSNVGDAEKEQEASPLFPRKSFSKDETSKADVNVDKAADLCSATEDVTMLSGIKAVDGKMDVDGFTDVCRATEDVTMPSGIKAVDGKMDVDGVSDVCRATGDVTMPSGGKAVDGKMDVDGVTDVCRATGDVTMPSGRKAVDDEKDVDGITDVCRAKGDVTMPSGSKAVDGKMDVDGVTDVCIATRDVTILPGSKLDEGNVSTNPNSTATASNSIHIIPPPAFPACQPQSMATCSDDKCTTKKDDNPPSMASHSDDKFIDVYIDACSKENVTNTGQKNASVEDEKDGDDGVLIDVDIVDGRIGGSTKLMEHDYCRIVEGKTSGMLTVRTWCQRSENSDKMLPETSQSHKLTKIISTPSTDEGEKRSRRIADRGKLETLVPPTVESAIQIHKIVGGMKVGSFSVSDYVSIKKDHSYSRLVKETCSNDQLLKLSSVEKVAEKKTNMEDIKGDALHLEDVKKDPVASSNDRQSQQSKMDTMKQVEEKTEQMIMDKDSQSLQGVKKDDVTPSNDDQSKSEVDRWKKGKEQVDKNEKMEKEEGSFDKQDAKADDVTQSNDQNQLGKTEGLENVAEKTRKIVAVRMVEDSVDLQDVKKKDDVSPSNGQNLQGKLDCSEKVIGETDKIEEIRMEEGSIYPEDAKRDDTSSSDQQSKLDVVEKVEEKTDKIDEVRMEEGSIYPQDTKRDDDTSRSYQQSKLDVMEKVEEKTDKIDQVRMEEDSVAKVDAVTLSSDQHKQQHKLNDLEKDEEKIHKIYKMRMQDVKKDSITSSSDQQSQQSKLDGVGNAEEKMDTVEEITMEVCSVDQQGDMAVNVTPDDVKERLRIRFEANMDGNETGVTEGHSKLKTDDASMKDVEKTVYEEFSRFINNNDADIAKEKDKTGGKPVMITLNTLACASCFKTYEASEGHKCLAMPIKIDSTHYRCPYCEDKVFTRRYNCSLHINKHSIDESPCHFPDKDGKVSIQQNANQSITPANKATLGGSSTQDGGVSIQQSANQSLTPANKVTLGGPSTRDGGTLTQTSNLTMPVITSVKSLSTSSRSSSIEKDDGENSDRPLIIVGGDSSVVQQSKKDENATVAPLDSVIKVHDPVPICLFCCFRHDITEQCIKPKKGPKCPFCDKMHGVNQRCDSMVDYLENYRPVSDVSGAPSAVTPPPEVIAVVAPPAVVPATFTPYQVFPPTHHSRGPFTPECQYVRPVHEPLKVIRPVSSVLVDPNVNPHLGPPGPGGNESTIVPPKTIRGILDEKRAALNEEEPEVHEVEGDESGPHGNKNSQYQRPKMVKDILHEKSVNLGQREGTLSGREVEVHEVQDNDVDIVGMTSSSVSATTKRHYKNVNKNTTMDELNGNMEGIMEGSRWDSSLVYDDSDSKVDLGDIRCPFCYENHDRTLVCLQTMVYLATFGKYEPLKMGDGQRARFMCPVCYDDFPWDYNCRAHTFAKHVKNLKNSDVSISVKSGPIPVKISDDTYACPCCRSHFNSHQGCRSHLKSCNEKGKSRETNLVPYKSSKPRYRCPFCPEVHTRPYNCRYHVMKQHTRNEQPGAPNEPVKLEHERYLCPFCSKEFSRESTCKKHIDYNHRHADRLICGTCHTTYESYELHRCLALPIKEKSGNYRCPYCPNKVFTRCYNCTAHIKEKHSDPEKELRRHRAAAAARPKNAPEETNPDFAKKYIERQVRLQESNNTGLSGNTTNKYNNCLSCGKNYVGDHECVNSRCPHCDLGFKLRSELMKHILTNHELKFPSDDQGGNKDAVDPEREAQELMAAADYYGKLDDVGLAAEHASEVVKKLSTHIKEKQSTKKLCEDPKPSENPSENPSQSSEEPDQGGQKLPVIESVYSQSEDTGSKDDMSSCMEGSIDEEASSQDSSNMQSQEDDFIFEERDSLSPDMMEMLSDDDEDDDDDILEDTVVPEHTIYIKDIVQMTKDIKGHEPVITKLKKELGELAGVYKELGERDELPTVETL